MPSKIYLFNYNNYYNRKVKILKDDELSSAIYTQDGINFNRADGIYTSQVINYPATEKNPDYAVVTDVINGVEKITSRWYVMEASWQRLNQYVLSLKRDVLADYWSDISTCTAHIYKGWVSPTNDLIFNSEGTSLNKIKTNEILLKDKSITPWIVGYIGEKGMVDKKTITGNRDADASIIYASDEVMLSDFPGTVLGSSLPAVYNTGSVSSYFEYEFYVKSNNLVGTVEVYKTLINSDGWQVIKMNPTSEADLDHLVSVSVFSVNQVNGLSYYQSARQLAMVLYNQLGSTPQFNLDWNADNNITSTNENKVLQNKGIIVKSGVNKYYTLDYSRNDDIKYTTTATTRDDAPKQMDRLYTALSVAADSSEGATSYGRNIMYDAYRLPFEVKTYNWTYNWLGIWNDLVGTFVTEEIGATTVTSCKDAPYYMFAIPYGTIKFLPTETASDTFSDPNVSYNLANEMIKQFGDNLYDIQILPYFPVQQILANPSADPINGLITSFIDLSTLNKSCYTLVKTGGSSSNNYATFIYWSYQSTFSFSIDQNLALWSDVKLQNETETVRLCSPNYASYYEFSTAKNRGVSSFNVDCNYKPGIPYIHVCPSFNEEGIYGNNYNDARGLICSGDFSMTQVRDAFINYQLSNKNYNLIFDRQMQSLDVQQSVARKMENWNIVGGTMNAVLGGGKTGAAIGGAAGATIGAVAAGGLSLAGGLLDKKYNEQLRTDVRDSTQTIHNLQIGNIQAMPDTLTKVGAQNQNNKLYPFIEIYRCTQMETEAFLAQIKYSGMTVGVTDQLNKWFTPSPDASTNFIQADVVRLEIPDDNHVIATIADELRKGVYVTKV